MDKSHIKVLLVDDDIVERQAIKRELTLKHDDYHVSEACTAEEAYALIENLRFDVVIIDYQMPRINGIEAIIRIRNISKLKHAAIVMISNNSDEQLMLDCINAGAQDFLLKSDVTESQLARTILQSRKRHELELELCDSYEQVKNLAERDKLTGLHNRYYFDEALSKLLANQQRRPNEITALMLFDLDRFKHINDTFGHETGDKLLIAVVERLSKVLRGEELFARLGGDEFVLAFSHLERIQQIRKVAQRLSDVFNRPFTINEHTLYCSASMGVAISPLNGNSVEELLKFADIAMYRAKTSTQMKFCIFEDNMQETFLRNYKIESELRSSIKNNEFDINYQPIIDINENKIVGAEALIRWPSGKTSTRPDEFIPVAEEAGLIHDIGKWVLHQAIHQLEAWLVQGENDLYMSINVSPVQLADREFTNYVLYLLQMFQVPAQQLVFEITETALLSEDNVTLEALKLLRNKGVSVALDDFGTGFSSISHLLNYPIDIVKIDKSIIQNITSTDSIHRNMLEGLSFMLHKLQMKVVAEGVETQHQAQFCNDMNISLVQGYLYHKPLTETEFYSHLNSSTEQIA